MTGTIVLSCGHGLADGEEEVAVRWRDETCDAVSGFSNAVAHGTFCRRCADEWRERGDLIETDEQEREWLSAGREPDSDDETELERVTRERDEAVKFIRVIGEELMLAGYRGCDRVVTLANLRDLIRGRKSRRNNTGMASGLVTDEMVTAAMKAFEVFAPGRLRHPEAQEKRLNDIQGMRAALAKATELHLKGKK